MGKELGLFTFHPFAPGAGFWLGKGTTLYNTLADYMRGRLFPAGYDEVKTPIVYNKALWEQSGHWSHYRENMFLVKSADGEEMGLKAMNCPGHYLLYSSEKHSYKEMPIRFHEQTPLHRNEASGVLGGLTRVRQFSQDDAHCFVMESQIASEVEALLRLIQGVYGDFGLSYTAKLSTRPEKLMGEIATWDHAESALKQALESAGQAYTINAGDGAFYGPKIDFDITDAIGRKWQCGTIQLDYNAPERFDLTYVGADNAEHRPVVIHRAMFGSFERFIAILIEHFAGAFPLWLAPVQATVLPIADRHLDYARQVQARLAATGMRVVVDDRQEKVNLKIRDAQLQKVPYMLVVGDREASEGAVSVRSRTKGDLGGRPLDQFLTDALAEIASKRYPRSLCRCWRTAIAFDSNRTARRDDRLRINERIRVREIRVIDDDGQQLGIMPPPQALAIARQKGLDLVEISPTAVPPVCRIMDYGKYQYQEQKRTREAKRHQKVILVKEIKFRPKVDEHDYQFKKNHIERFIERRRQGEGDDLLPWARNGAPGDRPPHPDAPDRGPGRRGAAGNDAAAGRQPDAHHPDRQEGWLAEEGKPRRPTGSEANS